MALLADLERLLERVFERSTARVFRATLQPVQLERRVERAMERARVARAGRIDVPARYRVRLHPADLAAVTGAAGGPERLAERLADAALAFARAHAYHLPERPRTAIVSDPSLTRGLVEVEASVDVALPGPDESGARLRVPDVPALPPSDIPPLTPAIPPAAVAADDAAYGGIRGDGSHTMVFRRPTPPPTRAAIRVTARDGTERLVEVDGAPLGIGRAADNGLVLADPRVSRHHARLQARGGTLVLTDLASTNGSRVNGIRVDQCALGIGDRIVLGDTILLVERLPG